MAVLHEDRCGQQRSRHALESTDTVLSLHRQAERLLATEISFVHRAGKGRSAQPEIADVDQFLNEISAGGEDTASPVSERPAMLPVRSHLLTEEQERRLFLHMNSLKCRANALRSRIDPVRPSRQLIETIESLLADVKRIRDCLAECNLRLVLSIARKFSNTQNQFEELASEGMPVLMRCIELFDASRGYRFSTYVTHSVQRHLYRVIRRHQRQRQRFTATDAEILGNVVEERDERPELLVDHAGIVAAILEDAESQLDSREQFIIQRRFGLGGDGAQTLRQLAGDLGISKERVRQLQIRAMDKLQDVAISLNFDSELL